MIPLVLMGARGRMGRAVERAAAEAEDLRVVVRAEADDLLEIVEGETGRSRAGYAKAEETNPAAGGRDPLLEVLRRGDVVIDFSSPSGLRRAARACGACGAALVSGTTGLGAEEERVLDEAASRVAVLRAANFSLGMVALGRAVAAALESLPPGWDVEIVERHHRRKVDSPSGTAFALARQVAAQRGLDPEVFRYGRSGRAGPRPREEIGIHAVRGGSWVGDHAVLLAGDGESLELRHVAEDRAAFAHGALAAARFVAHAAPGRYALEDVLTVPGRPA